MVLYRVKVSNSVCVAVLIFTLSFSGSVHNKSSSNVVSSILLGIFIFCPSCSRTAKLIFVRLASAVNPPAASMASAILAPCFSSTSPSFSTQPTI